MTQGPTSSPASGHATEARNSPESAIRDAQLGPLAPTVSFSKERLGTGQPWFRPRAVGIGKMDHDFRRAALNLLEDAEQARRQEEEAKRTSELRYQKLFESIDQAFCVIEVIFDADGNKAIDHVFLEANPAFERHTGLSDPVGRTMRELVPSIEQHWFDVYGRVAQTGESARFESRVEVMGRDFDVSAFRIDDADHRRVALLFSDITQRKIAEEKLRTSEERLRTLSNEVPQLIWTNDAGGFANYFNLRWHDYTGLTLAESYGLGWEAVVHPEDAAVAKEKWHRAFVQGQVFAVEFRLRGRNGEYRWFIGRNVPMRAQHGPIISWFGTATDIHDLKMAQRAVHEREEQLGRAIEDAPFPVILQAEDGQVLAVSRTWTDLTGYRRAVSSTTGPWETSAYGVGGERVKLHMQRVFTENRSIDREDFAILENDGQHRYWVVSASEPGTLADGRRFTVGMILDVTQRKRVESALAVSQERLRKIVESAQDYAIITTDEERNVTSWNPGAQNLSGYSTEEMLGRSADILFTREDRIASAPEREVSLAEIRGRSPDERWHVRKDGTRFWGSGVMLPMRVDQEIIGYLKIFRDETEKRTARDKLENHRQELLVALQQAGEARQEAEAASQAKDHFLAVLSHELRTPLTPILMAAHSLARRKDLPEPVREALAMIRTHVQLETRLVDDLLDVTRIARGKMEISRQPLDLHDVISQAVAVAQADVDNKKQTLTVSLTATEHRFEGDPTRLKQVVWNLLKNASKFSPEGGTIQLRTSSVPGTFRLHVTDSGIGIEKEAMTRIFDAFAQANVGITREFGGLGLGLSISQAAVAAHGGTIHAESEGLGHGATFVVTFPLSIV